MSHLRAMAALLPAITAMLVTTGCSRERGHDNQSGSSVSACKLMRFTDEWAQSHEAFTARPDGDEICTLFQGEVEVGGIQLLDAQYDAATFSELLKRRGFRITQTGSTTLAVSPERDWGSIVMLPSGRFFQVDTSLVSDPKKAQELAGEIIPLLVP